MKKLVLLVVCMLWGVGCASTPPNVVVKLVPEPYPVIVTVPCVQGELAPPYHLKIMDLPASVTWAEAMDAVAEDIQQLKLENDALRKEFEACSSINIPQNTGIVEGPR